jgi:hypothetical protein
MSPAADHLFTVRDPSLAKALLEEQAMAFHRAMAQLLFLSARAWRDIQPAIAFLTTRVWLPDKDDWGKVKRVLGYLKGTLHMPLILLADLLTLSRWWVDAAYAVHDNCRGHTGAGISFGQGMALSYSWKQKINTKSSSEAELVGVDDSLGYILWARYFMIEQGYDMDPSLLYQDNMSAILLKTNGRASSSKRTEHIKVKYFLIKDKVNREEITIEHCPTEQMWTDMNMKPKQGAAFRAFRGHVMGIPPDYNDASFGTRCNFRPPNWISEPVLMLPIPKDRVATQECVGEQVTNKESAYKYARYCKRNEAQQYSKGKQVTFDLPSDVKERTSLDVHQPAPIKMVRGHVWSPGIYRALRLWGKSLDVAWERVFIHPLTFN